MEIPIEHQLPCSSCGQIIDMRDLGQVFAHEECNGTPLDYNKIENINYSSSMKIGDNVQWTKDKKGIDLN